MKEQTQQRQRMAQALPTLLQQSPAMHVRHA
jgi:hypothetical protein